MGETPVFQHARTRKAVFAALLAARSRMGGKTEILVDADNRKLTYDEIVRGAFAVGSHFKRYTKKGEAVGVLLPTGAGAAIAYFGLTAYGRVPAMLNFTSGSRNIKAAIKAAEIKHIVTAHKFIELGGLEPLMEEIKGAAEFIYLDDVRDELSLVDKVAGGLGPLIPWAFRSHPNPDDTTTILFTSGTEGMPKGVVLSHANLVVNVEQIKDHITFFDNDVILCPLPTFHCFGLMGGLLLSCLGGIKAVLHPSPLQTKIIPKRVKETDATILVATDTFMTQYMRTSDKADLVSLRAVVCGAERVRDETRAAARKRFDVNLIEGYGVTEASPAVAINQPENNNPGTVGQLLAGMEARIDPVEGIKDGGRLFLRGPNVMKGYITPDEPGVLKPLEDGWHDTGDIAMIDEDRYITIKGRVKRFAKIGGEMVSLAVVENCASAIWPDALHAAVALPDDRKGEQIILLTDVPEANRAEIATWSRNHGVPELAVPRKVVHVEEVPVLGTGKTNYVEVKRIIVEEVLAGKAA